MAGWFQADPSRHASEHLALLWSPNLLELAVYLHSRRLTAAQAAVDAATPAGVTTDSSVVAGKAVAVAANAAQALSTALEQLQQLGADGGGVSGGVSGASDGLPQPALAAHGRRRRTRSQLLRATLQRYLHSALASYRHDSDAAVPMPAH